eukprot:6941121-Prymnesium_polylepis.3
MSVRLASRAPESAAPQCVDMTRTATDACECEDTWHDELPLRTQTPVRVEVTFRQGAPAPLGSYRGVCVFRV